MLSKQLRNPGPFKSSPWTLLLQFLHHNSKKHSSHPWSMQPRAAWDENCYRESRRMMLESKCCSFSLICTHLTRYPHKREAQTTQLHHLSPASSGALLPCLHAQPSLLQAYFSTKPPPHSAASRQADEPFLGGVAVCSFTKTTQTMLYKTLTPYYLFSPFTEYDLCSWVRNPVLLLFIMERLKDQAEHKWGETELQQKAKQGVEPIPTRTATHPITRQLRRSAEAPQHQLDSMALKNPTSNAKALLLLVQPHQGTHLQKGC